MRIYLSFAAALIAALWTSSHAAAQSSTGYDGSWRGQYVCAQGRTGVTLRLRSGGPAVVGVFAFYPIEGNPDVPNGCFEVYGEPQGDALRLYGRRWIQQPDFYQMIVLEGGLTPDRQGFRGRVDGPGCTLFELRRVPAIRDDSHRCYAGWVDARPKGLPIAYPSD